MTVYARSDVAAVAIPVASGGCGYVHTRPVIDGAPVKVFALACPACETKLRTDPCWSPHPDTIPQTADEERAAKKLAEEGTGTMRQVAEALAMSAGKILHEKEQAEIEKAAENARLAAAAQAEIAAAEAERMRAEQDARLRAATRVAESVAPKPAPKAAAKAEFGVELHPDRTCRSCGGPLTRHAGSAGRWPANCVDCRQPAAA